MHRAGSALAVVLAALLVAACGSDDTSSGSGASGGSGGSGGSTTTGGSGGAGGGTAGGTAGAGGVVSTCDDLGFCGQAGDPGCVACAITDGACVDEWATCKDAPGDACSKLLDCYGGCPAADMKCQADCEAAWPDGIGPLGFVTTCAFCLECPVSCNVDPADCP